MKNCIILLIILDFSDFLLCTQHWNETLNNFHTDFSTLNRRKRTTESYTRFHDDTESSEFIVKVLDADAPPPSAPGPGPRPPGPPGPPGPQGPQRPGPQVDGFNMPLRSEPRTIVGAALPPGPAPAAGDYNRLVPKNNVALFISNGDSDDVNPLKGSNEPALPPLSLEAMGPPRHAQRDESPPAGPQFLPRPPPRSPAPLGPYDAMQRARNTQTNAVEPWTQRSGPSNFIDQEDPAVWPTRTTHTPSRTPDDRIIRPFPDERRTERISVYRSTISRFVPTHAGTTACSRTCDARRFNTELNTNAYKYVPVAPTASFIIEQPPRTEDNMDFMKNMGKLDDDISSTTATYHMLYDDEYDYDKDKEKEHKTQATEIIPEVKADEKTDDEYLNEVMKLEEELEVHETNKENDSEHLPKNTFRADDTYRLADRPALSCDLTKLGTITYRTAPSLPEIVAKMKKWAEKSPIAKLVDITAGNYTIMENPIYMMSVDDPSTGQSLSAKQTVMIVAGIQGRDHQAVTSTMYFLHELIEESANQKELLKSFRFWVIPVLNPDGYDYSRSFPSKRGWRKNLRQRWELCDRPAQTRLPACRSCAERGLRCFVRPCYGVHLDRNFEYQWISEDELRSQEPCGDLYAGPRQLSEPETLAFTRYMQLLPSPVHAFIAVKEGDVLGIMYPYSHTKKKRSNDIFFRQRASRAAAAAAAVHNRRYVAGQTSEFLGLYAGGIEDWVDGHMGVDNTFTIMMYRPGDERTVPESQLLVREVLVAVQSLLMAAPEPTVRLRAPLEPMRRPRALVTARAARLSATLMPLVAWAVVVH